MKGHKKRKGDKSTGTVVLTNDDYTLLIDALVEVAYESYKKIDECKKKLTSSITDLLQTLCNVVK